jgi:RHS repeat-associated protein
MLAEGGYVHHDGDANWWVSSGRVFYSPDATHTPAAELAFARQHFFLSFRFRSPLGADTVVGYDVRDLLLVRTEDATGNIVESACDYRVLQPALVTDPNGNRSAALYDALGAVVATAQMGKVGEARGDSLAGVEADLTDAQLAAFLADPLGRAAALLGRATSRVVHDVHAYERTRGTPSPTPGTGCTLAREVHDSDVAEDESSPVQVSFAYSDGFGREIQKKLRAEPGALQEGGASVDPRWIVSGWTVFNNKGKPVKSYEPFFSQTTAFEFAPLKGVGATVFYDAAERSVATLQPDKTWTKLVSDPWSQATWDANDTVLVPDPRADPDVGDLFRRLPTDEYLPTWHVERAGGALGVTEQRAAQLAAAHAGTPARSYLDTLGRTILTVADNGLLGTYSTRIEYDPEGNRLSVIDARGRVAMRYAYDILGHRLRSDGIDAGTRWVLNDIASKPLYGWDSLDRRVHMTYDVVRRPTEVRLSTSGGAESTIVKTEYGEAQGAALNHRSRIFRQWDPAGSVEFEAYDFKGNLLRSSRKLAARYRTDPDWSKPQTFEAGTHTTSTTFDALNRPTASTTQDGSVTRGSYNVANLLERVDVNLRGSPVPTAFVANLDYNAKGQRTKCEYGNGTIAELEYDPAMFRVARARATEGGTVLQDQTYTYDPMANVTSVREAAQQAIFFANQLATPHSDYVYDAIYRLVAADGREHIGQVTAPRPDWSDASRTQLPHPNDGLAIRRYLERYEYDEVGNIVRIVHAQGDLDAPGPTIWARRNQYHPGSNRLISTSIPGEPDQPTYSVTPGYAERYVYDADGNMRQLPHLPALEHQHQDRLRSADLGGGGKVFFVYDAGGQRVRTVFERLDRTRRKERIYLGALELYREYAGDGQTLTLERETLHVRDDARRVALVETRTKGDDGSPITLTRYQLTNRLGSVSIELDETGAVISYEEYHPYGSTAYQGVRAGLGASPKRYRFTGKERDEGTGFYYHGARYCAPWLGRWTTCDPPGISDGVSAYVYGRDNPVGYTDPSGTQSEPTSYDIGPFRAANFQLTGIEPGTHADFSLDLSGLFSGGPIGITSANAGGAVHLSSELSIPALGISGGTGSYRLGLESLKIANGFATADISGTALLHAGPVTLDLSVSGYGETMIPRFSLGDWRAGLDATVSSFRGWAGVSGRIQVGGPTVGAFSLSADAHGTSGTLAFHASVGIPSLDGGPATVIGGASGTGTFEGSRYSLTGEFHAALPPVAVAWGTVSLDSSSGFKAQGNYFGPLLGPLGLTPTIDPFDGFRPPNSSATRSDPPPTDPTRSSPPGGSPRTGLGTERMFEPGLSLGYSHFSRSSSGSTIFSIGFAPRASIQDYSLEKPPLGIAGSIPGLSELLYHGPTSTPAGWYIGASLTITNR